MIKKTPLKRAILKILTLEDDKYYNDKDNAMKESNNEQTFLNFLPKRKIKSDKATPEECLEILNMALDDKKILMSNQVKSSQITECKFCHEVHSYRQKSIRRRFQFHTIPNYSTLFIC